MVSCVSDAAYVFVFLCFQQPCEWSADYFASQLLFPLKELPRVSRDLMPEDGTSHLYVPLHAYDSSNSWRYITLSSTENVSKLNARQHCMVTDVK